MRAETLHPPLGELQRWMQAAIVAPAERSRDPEHGPSALAERHVRPSRTLAPAERVELYARMYVLRMRECLLADYPALARIAGELAFERIVRAHLERFPSRHWSLNGLGRRLPELLEGRALRVPNRALLRDIARLEAAIARVFDAPRSERLAPGALEAVPPERWPGLRLLPIAALELHAFDHPVDLLVRAAREGAALPPLRRKRTRVVVWRRDGIVWRMPLARMPHALLAALLAGATLGEALGAGAAAYRGSGASYLARVRATFAEWSSEGFFSAVVDG